MMINTVGLKYANGNTLPNIENFIQHYTAKFGNQKLFDLFFKYENLLIGITVDGVTHPLETPEDYEKSDSRCNLHKYHKG